MLIVGLPPAGLIPQHSIPGDNPARLGGLRIPSRWCGMPNPLPRRLSRVKHPILFADDPLVVHPRMPDGHLLVGARCARTRLEGAVEFIESAIMRACQNEAYSDLALPSATRTISRRSTSMVYSWVSGSGMITRGTRSG
jgi:hypothetical protein